ncbi:MAG: hypothetical protein RL065_28 [Bacteroidota bacterium]|jgi:uncharacterized protein YdeI (YjbR/CyaY-like superfamily)
MPTTDNRIDAYIEKAQPFAQPILKKIRATVHKACPEATETIKWGFPVFEYKGLLCGFASFKAHCSFNLWKYKLVEDKHGLIEKGERDGMGIFGKITSLKDLPSEKIMMDYLKQAIELNEKGIKAPAPARNKINPPLIIPDEFKKALQKNVAAKIAFEAFSYSHKKEYVEYINEAKREETKVSRIEKSIEKLAEGKSHNWKYETKK